MDFQKAIPFQSLFGANDWCAAVRISL